MKLLAYDEYTFEYRELIAKHQSFEIGKVPVDEMLTACEILEKEIEYRMLKCRIYTKNRAASLLAGVLNPAYGILAGASILAHNIFTLNPDYEIARDLANNRISVIWKNN